MSQLYHLLLSINKTFCQVRAVYSSVFLRVLALSHIVLLIDLALCVLTAPFKCHQANASFLKLTFGLQTSELFVSTFVIIKTDVFAMYGHPQRAF